MSWPTQQCRSAMNADSLSVVAGEHSGRWAKEVLVKRWVVLRVI